MAMGTDKYDGKVNGMQTMIGRTEQQIICGYGCSDFIIVPLLLRLGKDEGIVRGRKRRRENRTKSARLPWSIISTSYEVGSRIADGNGYRLSMV